mmetsp:Transcript_36678/g.72572  ORF Transcript_36678/g.72572 Transcript_36678/m.72572 type:complete len:278 (-) Transcript_36678:318-1151(-)
MTSSVLRVRVQQPSQAAETISVNSRTSTKPSASSSDSIEFSSGEIEPPSRTDLLVAMRSSTDDCSNFCRSTLRPSGDVTIHGKSTSYCFTRRSLRMSKSILPFFASCTDKCAEVSPPPTMTPWPLILSTRSESSNRSQACCTCARAAASKALWNEGHWRHHVGPRATTTRFARIGSSPSAVLTVTFTPDWHGSSDSACACHKWSSKLPSFTSSEQNSSISSVEGALKLPWKSAGKLLRVRKSSRSFIVAQTARVEEAKASGCMPSFDRKYSISKALN